MADATTIADLVVPEVWSAYAQENLPFHSTIQASGKIEINNAPDVIGGDEYTREPKFKPLSSSGDAERIQPATNVTLDKLGAYAEYGVIARRAKGWSQEDLASIATGADPMAAGMSQFTEYWARQIEKSLHSVVKAVFGTSGALTSTHQVDNSGSALKVSHLPDGKFLLGEAFDVFDAMVVSSTHMASLTKLGIVDYVDAGAFGESILRTGRIPVVMGMQVVVNDTLCAAWSGSTYPIYLLGSQPIRVSFQRPVRMESDRDIKLAAGTDIFVSSTHFAPHVKGCSWSSSGTINADKNPTEATLATASKWEKVATNDSDIRIVQILADA